ncbi:MAG: IS200/IS605 family transposase [Acidobacteria bacterium]|nr:IS200/IS605 family transposase [Acidobacteriota bacterium]
MANTYSQIYIQIVFAVSGRENLIAKEWKAELYKYITGIVTNHGQKLLAINGVADHVHILLNIKPNIALSDLVRDIKANSSRWINERKLVRGKFQWQEGFGAFSYSISQLDDVIDYIRRQESHHEERTFKQEYLAYLDRFRVDFDDRFVFDWIDE